MTDGVGLYKKAGLANHEEEASKQLPSWFLPLFLVFLTNNSQVSMACLQLRSSFNNACLLK